MAAPFDLRKTARRAAELESELREQEEYRDDFLDDPALGPLLRTYALLTHLPDKAFDQTPSAKDIADYRLYTFARLARLHAKRDGCDCLELDVMDDLLSELDEVADMNSMQALKAGAADANTQYAKLKKNGQAEPKPH